MKPNPYITEFGRNQNATRYEIRDDIGNAATFSPAELLEIMDILLVNASAIIKEKDATATAPGEQPRQREQIDADLQTIEGEILKMRRKIVTINSKVSKLSKAASATTGTSEADQDAQ